jgi:hypothetical protein
MGAIVAEERRNLCTNEVLPHMNHEAATAQSDY